jgi:hypothetical protein
MSLVNRGILFPLVALALAAAPLGCASPSVPDEDDLAAAAADSPSSHTDLVNAIGLDPDQQAKLAELRAAHPHHHDGGLHSVPHRPTVEQIVNWFTSHLDLTPEQAAKLRAYLEAHAPSAEPAHT